MLTLAQLRQDFDRDARRLVSKRCNSCVQFGSLLEDLKKRGEPAEIAKFRLTIPSGQITYAVARTLLHARILYFCVGERGESTESLTRALQGPFFSFINNAQNAHTAPPHQNSPIFVSQIPVAPVFYLTFSQPDQITELVKDPYLQQLIHSSNRIPGLIRDWNTVLGLFDQHPDILKVGRILKERDVSDFDLTMKAAKLIIAAATINGNERDSDKFGKLMELIELKFGKKPSRVPEEKFMQSVATALQNKISELSRPLCVGVQYIQKWANRQF